MILINQHYIEHGELPPTFTVQLDNASSNKNILVLGFLAIYVLLGIFKSVRVRFLLENHAHDVYDAFQGIHAKKLERVPHALGLAARANPSVLARFHHPSHCWRLERQLVLHMGRDDQRDPQRPRRGSAPSCP